MKVQEIGCGRHAPLVCRPLRNPYAGRHTRTCRPHGVLDLWRLQPNRMGRVGGASEFLRQRDT